MKRERQIPGYLAAAVLAMVVTLPSLCLAQKTTPHPAAPRPAPAPLGCDCNCFWRSGGNGEGVSAPGPSNRLMASSAVIGSPSVGVVGVPDAEVTKRGFATPSPVFNSLLLSLGRLEMLPNRWAGTSLMAILKYKH